MDVAKLIKTIKELKQRFLALSKKHKIQTAALKEELKKEKEKSARYREDTKKKVSHLKKIIQKFLKDGKGSGKKELPDNTQAAQDNPVNNSPVQQTPMQAAPAPASAPAIVQQAVGSSAPDKDAMAAEVENIKSIALMEGQLASFKEQVNKLSRDISDANRSKAEAEDALLDRDERIKGLLYDIDQFDKRKEELNQEHLENTKDIRRNLRILKKLRDTNEKTISELQAELADTKKNVSTLTEDLAFNSELAEDYANDLQLACVELDRVNYVLDNYDVIAMSKEIVSVHHYLHDELKESTDQKVLKNKLMNLLEIEKRVQLFERNVKDQIAYFYHDIFEMEEKVRNRVIVDVDEQFLIKKDSRYVHKSPKVYKFSA